MEGRTADRGLLADQPRDLQRLLDVRLEKRQVVHIPEDIGRMEGGEEGHPLRLCDPAPQLRDPGLRHQQRLHRDVAQAADQLRLDRRDLPLQPGHARRHLVRRRRPVARRTALEDVADEDLAALDAQPLQRVREQLARAAHERLALQILILPRRLADEHQRRLHRARAEHHLRPRRTEPAAPAVQHLGPELLEVRGPVLLPGMEGRTLLRRRRPGLRSRLRRGGAGLRSLGGGGALLRDRKEIRSEQLLHLDVPLDGPRHWGMLLTKSTVSPTTVFSASSIVPRKVAPDARGWPPPLYFAASVMPLMSAFVRHETLTLPGSSVSFSSTATRTPLIDFTWSMYSCVSPAGEPVLRSSSFEITTQPTWP